ncbi:MAG: hypothetical protein WCD18_22565 [Thermosynechococcaceae cyanobacterium]
MAIAGVVGLGVALGGLWMAQSQLTYKGVPLSIIVQFVQDPIAREAYFAGNKQRLHNRLDEMGVEDQIKDFYRSRIPDEKELDQYIHQLLYENTGYVGEAYRLDSQGKLVLKPTLTREFWTWFRLAKRLKLVTDKEIEEDVIYLITPKGSRVPYEVISSIYSIEDLHQLMTLKNPKK